MARKKKQKTILVTGASGFLGYHLVQELLCRDQAVKTLTRSPNARLASLGVEQVHGSIVDPDVCLAAVDGVSAVYHVAGTVARTPDDAGFLYDVHVNGTTG